MRSLIFLLVLGALGTPLASSGIQPPIALPTSIVAYDPLEFAPESARLSWRHRVTLDDIWVRLTLDSSDSIRLIVCGNVGVGVSRNLVRKRLQIVQRYLAQMTRAGMLRRNPGSTIPQGVTHVRPEQIILVERDGECRACGGERVDAIRVHLVDRKAYLSAGGLDCH